MPQPHIHKNISNSIRRVIHDTRNLSDNPTYGISKRLLASALAIVAGSAVAVGCALAEGSVEFSLTVPDTPVLEVVIQGTDAEGDINLSMAPTMAKADFNTADVAVTVGTSSTAGYNLKMAVGNSGQLISGGNSIPSLAAAEDENGDPYSCTKATKLTCNFTVNSWGYWMTGDIANNYKPIPSAETELANYTTGATNGVTTELEFGVRVNAKQAGGDYQTTINFIATANPEPVDDISKVKKMQDFAMLSAEEYTAVLASMDSEQAYTLADSRDDNSYTIQKLADGNVWMLDNLALDPSAQELNSSNTNVTSTVTKTFENKTSGWTDTSPNDAWGKAYFNLASKDIPVQYGNNSSNTTKVGGYYNYCAASAGTICAASGQNNDNASYDICPAGWKMPNGDTAKGSYYYLYNTGYSSNVANFKNALHAGLSGFFYGSSAGGQGSSGYGYFWSATLSDGNRMYDLYVYASDVYPQNGNGRDRGNSVRCVLKPYAYDMQNVSAETMASILPTNGSTYVMKDNRDGTEYTIGKLADGNYWMLDNLALGGSSAMTLDSSNTNLADNTTYILPASGTQCFTDQNTTCTGAAGSLNVDTEQVKTNTNGYQVATINADYKNATHKKDDSSATFTYNSNGDVSKAGVYYNYCAASAGTYCYAYNSAPAGTNVQYDICPKGWRLPTGGSSGEFQALTNNLVGETSSFTDTVKHATFKAAFHAGLSGSFYNGSVQGQAILVGFLSSTRNDDHSMYALNVTTSAVNPQSGCNRFVGCSVRCVYGS